jgi:hypothetical protein
LQQFFDRANISTMDVQEEKVLLSPDGYGRVAIVRRADGLLCLYRHWHWSPEVQRSFGVVPIEDRCWTADYDPRLYEDVDPLPGVYATVADAERQAEHLLGLRPD